MPYKNTTKANAYQREYRRTRRSGERCTTPCTTQLPLPFRLKTASDVLRLIEEQVQAVRHEQNANALDKARCIGYLGGMALKAIEAGNIVARVESLEAVLKQRSKDSNGQSLKAV